MSADVAQPPSPPKLTGSRIPSTEQPSSGSSSGSSSLQRGDNVNVKSGPPLITTGGITLTSNGRRARRRSECTENGSIGYGSSAPLESETSYSSHPGYPSKALSQGQQLACKSPCSSEHQVVHHQHQHLHHHNYQNQQTGSPNSASQSSSSTPSSGAYVDVSSSARLNCPPGSTTTTTTSGGGGVLRPRNALVKSRTVGLTAGPSTSSWNGSLASENETGYVVDSEKGNAYFKGALLGKGGFARVYLITDIATKKQYACKIIPKHQMQKIHLQKIAREIMIHKELNHVNVVQMHHYFEDSLNVYMLLEACPRKSLVHVLKYRGKVTEPEARYYMKQMVTGVAYIHSQKVIHRDLKPGNMFLSEKMIVKIGDFGLATQPDGQRRRVTICGTPNFIAPEVLFKQSYSYEADVWALGCILYALLVGHPPFDSSTLKETYARICNHRYKELDDTIATRAGQDLVRWLLQPNPELRPSLELVKEHAYLAEEYVPATLLASCCYQAPRLSFIERVSALTSFSSSSNNFTPAQQNLNQANQTEQSIQPHIPQSQPSQKSQDGKSKSKTKKKKVSSWLASWRLPKLPRFRQRISSVLCLEARKKQPQVLGAAGGDEELANLPQSLLMSRALEDCLAATSKGPRTRCNPPLVKDFAPLFVTKWIDYSNKYGLAFQLSDRSVGVLFNDSTKMSYTCDRRRVEYMTTDDEVTRYNRERNIPAHLQEKLDLLRHFTGYMDTHLTEGGEVMTTTSTDRTSNSQNGAIARRSAQQSSSVPLMRRWLRTSKAIVMELSVPLLQMNFFDDHTKLIVSQEPQTRAGLAGYLVTYIDGERRASTYWLNDLRDYGCTAELHERLLYVYKVAKEFAELDAAQAE